MTSYSVDFAKIKELPPLPEYEEVKRILINEFESIDNRTLPKAAAFMHLFYGYKWETYAKTYSVVSDIRRIYIDHKAKGKNLTTNS